MSETIKLKIDWKAVNAVEAKVCWALGLTAHELQTEIREAMVIPRDSGALQGTKFFVDDSEVKKGRVRLVHEGPYARRLYYHPEYNFNRAPWVDSKGKKHEGNANAQGLWFRPWQKGGAYEKRPQEIFVALLKKEL